MKSRVDHIFVYGTLRRKHSGRERQLLDRFGKYVGLGRVSSARLFDLGPYPGAVKGGAEEHEIKGELYRLPQEHMEELLNALDKYEEFDKEDPQGSLYVRDITAVEVNSRRVKAWIYWYNRPIDQRDILRHGNYARRDLHVVPHGDGWAIKVAGMERANSVLPTRHAAIERAKALVGRIGGPNLIIHGRNGRIQERRSVATRVPKS